MGTSIRYGFEILHQYGKRVKTKCQKILVSSSYVCRSYRGKAGRGSCFATAPPLHFIMNRVNRKSDPLTFADQEYEIRTNAIMAKVEKREKTVTVRLWRVVEIVRKS